MKKILAALIAVALMVGLAACDSPDPDGAEPGSTSTSTRDTLTIGTTTQVNADMFDGWTNNSPNAHIKYLIHGGLSVLEMTPGSELVTNPTVIESQDVVEHEDGSKTFFNTIREGLVWSDGTPITAADYVFYWYLRASPEWKALDANNVGVRLTGYDDFNSGDTKVFSGLTLVDDRTFGLTYPAHEFPFYYESTYADTMPHPIHVLVPGATMKDDGDGVYIEGDFTVEVLRKTVLDPQTGYRYNPQVTCGAYRLVSYDTTTNNAILERNPSYPGTYLGTQPKIERIIYKFVQPATQMNELEVGEIDLVSGIGGIQQLEPGFALVDRGIVTSHSYNRNGYGYVRFHCDFGPTQFAAVRQAMTYLTDREDFVRLFSGGYAIIINSGYSQSQWVYQENKEWLEENLIHYTFNPDKALEVLIEDGWTLNAQGNAFNPATDKMRYKRHDGELMPLQIEWASSNNVVSELLRTLLVPEAERVGMIINETIMTSVLEFSSRNGVRDEDAFYHMFNMGHSFGVPYSPWLSYSMTPAYWGGNYNSNYLADEEMHEIVEGMRLTDPKDRERFGELWLQQLVRFNELMPNLVLYADTYFDFYTPALKNFVTNPTYDARYAVLFAHLED